VVSFLLDDHRARPILLPMLDALFREREQIQGRYENDGVAALYVLHHNLHFLFHDSALDLLNRFDCDLLAYPQEDPVQSFLLLLPGLLGQLLRNSVLHYVPVAYKKELISGVNFVSHRVVLSFICNNGSSHAFLSVVLPLNLSEPVHEPMHQVVLLAEFEHLKRRKVVAVEHRA